MAAAGPISHEEAYELKQFIRESKEKIDEIKDKVSRI